MHIYITGRYNAEAFKLEYACIATADGCQLLEAASPTFSYGELLGSRPETELRVAGQALLYAYNACRSGRSTSCRTLDGDCNNIPVVGKQDVTIHTDFSNIQKRVNGRIKAASQSAKDFAATVQMAKEKISIQVIEELSSEEQRALSSILDDFCGKIPSEGWKTCIIKREKVNHTSLPTRSVERDWFACIASGCIKDDAASAFGDKSDCTSCEHNGRCEDCLGSVCVSLCADCIHCKRE